MTSPLRFLVHFLACDGILADPVRSFQVDAENELAALAHAKSLVGTPFCSMPTDVIQVLDNHGRALAFWRVPAGLSPTRRPSCEYAGVRVPSGQDKRKQEAHECRAKAN